MCINSFPWVPYRTMTYDDESSGTLTLSGRSQALGVMLTVLLMGLIVCLLGLLLYKRERR